LKTNDGTNTVLRIAFNHFFYFTGTLKRSGMAAIAIISIYKPIKRMNFNDTSFLKVVDKSISKYKFKINIYFMSDFLTRVELHDAKWPDDYVGRFHTAMAREGFFKDYYRRERRCL
jgi:hypothetical protein